MKIILLLFFGGYRVRKSWFMTTLNPQNQRKNSALAGLIGLLVFFPLLVGLGFWQLHRADVKRDLQAEYDRRAVDKPVAISSRLQAEADLQFYRVEARGRYEREYEILLDNRVHNGRVGYYVLTPLRIGESNMRVLVNRGWVAQGRTREDLPATPASTREVLVEGVATVPVKGAYRIGPPIDPNKQWQTVWQYLNMELVDKKTPFPIQPVVVLLAPESDANGFVREWKRLDAGIAVHQGYAFQWFSLAVAVAAIYILLTVQSRRRND